MLMKRILLLVSFCCFGFIMQAQDFFIQNIGYLIEEDVYKSLDDRGYCTRFHGFIGDGSIYKKGPCNTYIWEKRLMGSPLLLRIGRINDTKKLPEFPELREEWLKKIKKKILSKELKHCLKDTSNSGDKRFWIDVHFEKDGTVFTVSFEIEQHLYEILPEKWVKETFNTLMKERINAAAFWDFNSSKEPDPLGVIRISVWDLFFGKIRDQEELRAKPTKPKGIYPPCGTFTIEIKSGY